MNLARAIILLTTILSAQIIPTLSSPSSNLVPLNSLSLRAPSTVGTIYWDTNPASTIRVIFNLALTNAFAQAILNSNTDLSQAVITTFRTYVSSKESPWLSALLDTATIYGQLGQHWRDGIRKPAGVMTVSFTMVLKEGGGALARYGVINGLRKWLSQGGNLAVSKRVADAAMAGLGTVVNGGEVKRDASDVANRDTVRTNFCVSGKEDWALNFAGGAADALAEKRFYCWSAISRENLLLRYGGSPRS